MGTGKLLIKVPASMRFEFEGELPPYLLAKDLILQVIGDISVSGANYRALQIGGEAIAKMSMEERMTLCNMAIEAGGKNAVIAPDQTTYDYVRSRTDKAFESLYADADASYYHVKHYDVSKLEPVVAKPHSPDNRALVREVQDVKIDRVYIGSCTGGKSEDFYHAAKLLKGQQVKVPTYLVPATQKVYNDLFSMKIDGLTLSEIFLQSGCIEPASPSCAGCLGGPQDTFGRINEAEVCVSTTNRNFPGRMGNKQAQIYLASPYTAAASALTGHITDPRDFM
jgi:3-isopropylmalate/(R)-2-methylmalate dehydratase large subunit